MEHGQQTIRRTRTHTQTVCCVAAATTVTAYGKYHSEIEEEKKNMY